MIGPPPDFISSLANSVAACLTSFEPIPPVGCHFADSEVGWEVTVFPSMTEIVGGPDDGLRTAARVCVDVASVVSLFSAVRELTWQCMPLGKDDELGAHLYIVGDYEGEPVCVQILASAPPNLEPGRKALFHQGLISDEW